MKFWYTYPKYEKKWIFGNLFEFMAFSELMRINIHIFISLDKITFEFEINYPHNVGTIWILLRNRRHYEGLQNIKNEGVVIKKLWS